MFGRNAKALMGTIPPLHITVVADLDFPSHARIVFTTGTATVTSIQKNKPTRPGQVLILIHETTGAATYTNTDGAATKGSMDLGGSNLVIADSDVLVIQQRRNGSWIRIFSTNN